MKSYKYQQIIKGLQHQPRIHTCMKGLGTSTSNITTNEIWSKKERLKSSSFQQPKWLRTVSLNLSIVRSSICFKTNQAWWEFRSLASDHSFSSLVQSLYSIYSFYINVSVKQQDLRRSVERFRHLAINQLLTFTTNMTRNMTRVVNSVIGVDVNSVRRIGVVMQDHGTVASGKQLVSQAGSITICLVRQLVILPSLLQLTGMFYTVLVKALLKFEA